MGVLRPLPSTLTNAALFWNAVSPLSLLESHIESALEHRAAFHCLCCLYYSKIPTRLQEPLFLW